MPNQNGGIDPTQQQAQQQEPTAQQDAGQQAGDAQKTQQQEPSGEPKYTDADVDAIVKKRLARYSAQIERDVRKQIEDEAANRQTEAQKLESMTELQRAQYEAKKLKAEKEELERERDLSQQTAIARRELASADINLGDDLLAMFVSADAEKTGKAIDQLKELWPKAVNEAVQRQLKRDPPKADPRQGGDLSFGASFAEQYSKSKIPNKNGGN